MESKDTKVRLQAMVDPEVLKKVDHYAKAFNLTRSKFVNVLLSGMLENDETVSYYVLPCMSTPFMRDGKVVPYGQK